MADTQIDFNFENHGSVVLIRPLTDDAKAFLPYFFGDDALTFGGAVACEPRFAIGNVVNLFDEGFTVALDGNRVEHIEAA